MTLPAMKQIFPAEFALASVEHNVAAAIAPVLNKQILDGLLLQSVSLGAGPTTINHNLGRNLLGWIIVDNAAGVEVWRSASTLPTKTLVLNASGPTVVSLWVF